MLRSKVLQRVIANQIKNFSLSFDGGDDYVSVGEIWNSTGPVTLAFWNKADASNGNGFGGGDTNDRFQVHAPFTDSKLYWDYGNTSTGRLSTDYTPYLNTWTHIALVSEGASGSRMAIYINGSEAESKNESDGPDIVIDFDIGRFKRTTASIFYHKGNIDDVYLFGRVLSGSEISDLYQGNSVSLTSIVGIWKMNEGEGATVSDSSGNGNNGTLQPNHPTNAPTWSEDTP